MKLPLIRLIASSCYQSGITRLMSRVGDSYLVKGEAWFPFSIKRRQANCFQILIYHRVNPICNQFIIDAISPELFEEQVSFLTQNFNVLAIEEIIDYINTGKKLPCNCIAITFDDGYADNYFFGYKILKKYCLPATFFLTTGCIETQEMLWFDKILSAFERTLKKELCLPYLPRKLVLLTEQDRLQSALQVLCSLRTQTTSMLQPAIEEVLDKLDVQLPVYNAPQMLTWSQVREMAENGYYIGSHTISHPILSRMSIEQAEKEIGESKRMIEQKIGRRVRTFAYPSGRPQDYSSEIASMVKQAGYEAALTYTSFKANTATSTGNNLYQLNRLRPWEHHLPTFF